MSRGRRKSIEEYKETVFNKEFTPAWGVDVKVKKCLLHHYRIPGKVGDIVNVPAELLDQMLKLKQVEKI